MILHKIGMEVVLQLMVLLRLLRVNLSLYEEVNKQILALAGQGIDTAYIGGELAWPVPGYTKISSPYAKWKHRTAYFS